MSLSSPAIDAARYTDQQNASIKRDLLSLKEANASLTETITIIQNENKQLREDVESMRKTLITLLKSLHAITE
jgi:hypothetical protein